MKTIFEDLITRYGTKRAEFIAKTWPKKPKWREIISVSESPRAEEYFDEEMAFYRVFEAELDDIPRLRNKEISVDQWEEVVHFLKIHNERLSSQIDNSTTLTATFVFMGSLFLLLANYVTYLFYFPFVFLAVIAMQIFLQRMGRRHELARNKEFVIIIENYIKKRRTVS
ncbi:hypothetical protein SAMN05216596_107159 [Pseudomonas congelans]|uniref:Uncharacterized protein n=1 Tax=Pseudomonas congelans TaxID=200452 RepID=A0A1H0V124_9PSED|nr:MULTISPECIES: hypothetical protein [Pseudomonas]SDP72160.1 hypothetical protein SAMN05216596_107159 [Pseudomonas congelans]